MHRIPRIFSSDKKSVVAVSIGSDSNFSPKPRKRLERRNAIKNIDYGLPSTSSSSSEDYLSLSTSALDSPSPSAAQRRRSLDNFYLDKQTSFRIEGNCPGEFEIICRSLGLSGAEDFSIPVEAWEDMKVRSPASDVLPRLSRFSCDGGSGAGDAVNRKIESAGAVDSACIVGDVVNFKAESPDLGFSSDSTPSPGAIDVIDLNLEAADIPAKRSLGTSSSGNADSGRGIRPLNKLRHSFGAVLDENEGKSDLVYIEQEGVEGIGCIRIKGVTPSPLTPPPAMSLPPIDRVCSTWDILKSFAPNDDDGDFSRPVVYEVVISEDEENTKRDEIEREDVDEEEVHCVVSNRKADDLLSESCSFSSNDDDSSSTTTEPMSNSIPPNGRFRRIISYWDKGELLGRGSFGSVYEGIADGGFFFAVKEVSLLDQGEGAQESIYQLEQEIALLSQFEHENIVQYYGTDKDASKLYIFLELVTKGSLLSLYQKYHLRDSQVSAYTRQILHGLKYLHDRNVVHRDIKCANILVDASGSVKLADFGLAKATKLNDVKSCKGTALWMAPEVVNRRNQGYGLAADIWSLGCTVLEMLTRQFPYSHLESMQALFRIGKGEPPRVPESLSKDARDFILQCLQVNPDSRPTAAQLLDHPFVQRSVSSSGCPSPYHPSRRV